MDKNSLDTKQIILAAAEAEFLEKGYGNAKTISIAKRAGVSHSMLHYYFSKKENLFQMIFMEKIQVILQGFEGIFLRHLPFAETVRLIIEVQFDFVRQNPQLPYFVLNEVLSNKENRTLVFEILYSKIANVLHGIEKTVADEIAKGSIRPVKISDVIMNILSLNISTFIALPILEEVFSLKNKEMLDKLLDERRESNVQFILNALKP
jgi:AcrR family transcriptional regulator